MSNQLVIVVLTTNFKWWGCLHWWCKCIWFLLFCSCGANKSSVSHIFELVCWSFALRYKINGVCFFDSSFDAFPASSIFAADEFQSVWNSGCCNNCCYSDCSSASISITVEICFDTFVPIWCASSLEANLSVFCFLVGYILFWLMWQSSVWCLLVLWAYCVARLWEGFAFVVMACVAFMFVAMSWVVLDICWIS